MSNLRLISHSETSDLLTCQYRWDLKYGFQLAGTSLRSKAIAPSLQDGKAWGAAVAAYDAGDPRIEVLEALARSLDKDADRLKKFKIFNRIEFFEQLHLLVDLIDHHMDSHQPLGIERLEHELIVPIPSRSGVQDSNRYRLQVFIDGILVDAQGGVWLVEYKLRDQLSSLEMIMLSRQIRWYAWAYRKEYGVEPQGILVRERRKAVPKPARLVQGKKKSDPDYVPSHAKDQNTTPELYRALCEEHGVEPKPETLASLADKKWDLHEPIFLTTPEIDEAGRQLVSAGQQIRAFDAGELYPVRNPQQMFCGGCAFKAICRDPGDHELVNALFERTQPKKDKPPRPIREEVPA